MRESELEEARATLAAIVGEAVSGAPTAITRSGRKVAVVLSFAEYQRLANVPGFGRLLAYFPGEADDLPTRRRRPRRPVDL